MKRIFLGSLWVCLGGFAMEHPKKTESLVSHVHKSVDVEKGIEAYHHFKNYKPRYHLSVDELGALFPILFSYIPKDLQSAIANYVPYKYPDHDALISELSKLAYSSFSLKIFKWEALGYYFGLMPFYNFDQGYFYFEQPKPFDENAILKGVREDRSIRALYELDELIKRLSFSRDTKREEYITHAKNEWQEVANSLVHEYKIHLMPQEDPTPVIVALLTLLKKDPELQHLIAAFKVMVTDKMVVQGITYPRIVIYPTKGKANAQKALNKLYAGLKEIKGLGLKPLYNAKVTDLIWIAQGDSHYKKISAYQTYFEKPDLVYYRKNLTGKDENYHLLHPETGKEII